MSDFFKDGTDALLDLLKTQGLPAVTHSLEKLTREATEEWQKSLLKLGVKLISDHGVDGLNILENTVYHMLNGKPVDLSGLTMQEASDILAIMQRAEADHRNQITIYTKKIIETLGKALVMLVSVLFKEIRL